MNDSPQPSAHARHATGRSSGHGFARRLRRRRFWRHYRTWILTGVALAALATGMWRYSNYRAGQQRAGYALFQEARQALAEQRGDDALRAAESCVALAPDIVEAYYLQANLLNRRGQTGEADGCIARMIAANPDVPQAYAYRGWYHLAAGRLDETEYDLKKGLELSADEHEVLLLAVDFWTRKEQYELARNYAQRLQTLFPGDPRGSLRLAELEARCADPAAAMAALQSGLQATPDNADLLYALINGLCEQGRSEEAQRTLRDAAGHCRDAVMLKLLSARIAHAQGQWEQARRQLEEVRPQLRENRAILQQLDIWLGECYPQMSSYCRQIDHWRMAVAANPDALPLRRGLIEALLSSGQIDDAIHEARAIKQRCATTAADDRVLLQLVLQQTMQLAPTQRQWQEAQTLLEAVGRAEPDSPQTALLRAELLVAQNRPEEAETVLRTARVAWPRRLELWLASAALAYRRDDDAAALYWLNEAKTRCGDSGPLRAARAEYLLWQYDGGQYRAFHRLAEHTPRMPAEDQYRLDCALARVAYRAGDDAQAVRLCTQAAALAATPSLWDLQLEIALRRGRAEDVERLLPTIEQTVGEGARWHYGKAVSLLLSAKDAKGDKSALPAGRKTAAADLDLLSPAQRMDPAAATRAANPALRARICEKPGSLAAPASTVAPLSPEFVAEMEEHLVKARELAPGWPCVPLLAAEFHAQSRPALAAANYLEALALGESSPPAVRRMLNFFYGQQRYLEADRVLRKLIARPPLLLAVLGGGELQAGLPPEDLSQVECAARQAVEKGSGKGVRNLLLERPFGGHRRAALVVAQKVPDPFSAFSADPVSPQLWLAAVLEVLGRQMEAAGRVHQAQPLWKQAETALQQALTEQPASPVVRAAAMGFYLRSNQADAARQILAAAEKSVPAEQLPCLLAQGWELLGNLTEAERHWQKVLTSASDSQHCDHAGEFFVRTKQEDRLRRLLEAIAGGKQPATAAAAAWARRNLAWMLVRGGGQEERQKALTLIDQNLAQESKTGDRSPFSPQDRQFKAALLMPSNDPAARCQALELQERALADHWHSIPENKFLLAQSYLAGGDVLRAKSNLVELASYFSEEPRYLVPLIRVRVQCQEIPLASLLVRRLERLAPGDFLTVEAEAEVAFAQGEFAAIPPLLHRYVEQLDSPMPDPALLQERPTALLNELAHRAKQAGQEAASAELAKAAQAIRWEAIVRQHEVALTTAGKLAHQGKNDEASRWLEQLPQEGRNAALWGALGRLWLSLKAAPQIVHVEQLFAAVKQPAAARRNGHK